MLMASGHTRKEEQELDSARPARARHHHLSTPIHAVKWQKKGPGLRLDRIRGDNGHTDSRKSSIAVSPVPFEL